MTSYSMLHARVRLACRRCATPDELGLLDFWRR